MTRTPCILAVEVSWQTVSGLIAGVGLIGGAVGYFVYRASHTYRQLKVEEKNDALVQANASATAYKNLYEAERERNQQLGRELIDLRALITRLREDMGTLREQNNDLVTLNLKWQQTVRQQDHDLRNRDQTIRMLKDQDEG